ncbi:MAG: hypothetical protein K8U57_36700 [Planctomycetes bacterium]|nr:hypothetical protein [Planctomycetota bacterium]
MCLRKGLLGLAAMFTITGSVLAEPPVNPLVEGREPNPVVREFYETEPAPFEYAGGSGSEVVLGTTWWVSRATWELLLNKLTMPLGEMELWD